MAFDEAHAMQNAAGSSEGRGTAPSQQGIAGLRLQIALPRARVVYISATGATNVSNLAYAVRLGLWGPGDAYPFTTREDFVAAMEAGGVAAMEVVARDLKALGLYTARALSFDGVEYDILEHALSDDERAIYDTFAAAFRSDPSEPAQGSRGDRHRGRGIRHLRIRRQGIGPQPLRVA